MSVDHLHGFYLNDLFVEPLKGQVTGKDESRHLPPKAVEVLLCLARAPGELVKRDTLLGEVWGQGKGSQEALSHAVGEIRHALGDHADDPVFIQTLPKRGYRLAVAPVPASLHTESIVIGSQGTNSDLGLFENLKQRGVLETALAYLILGWLLIQIADIVFAQLHLPSWAGTFATVLVITGFPIALILSWFLEFRDGRATLHELTPVDARQRRFSRTYFSVLAALGLAAIFVFAYDKSVGLPEADQPQATLISDPARLPPVHDNSIAVLPFMNVDGSNQTQAFSNGLVDDVINRLARVPGLRVSSRGDSFTLDPNTPSALVRKRLRVAMYLEGSVEIADDAIRVTVQLIDSADGFHIQSRTFDHPLEDFFQIRDEVTALTVSSLRVTLPDDVQAMSQIQAQAPDLDAYVLYRRGIDDLLKPGTTDTLSSAIGWMDAALEVDPEFAAAHAGKCRAYVALYRETDDPVTIDIAEQSCASALGRNPNLDVVHTALGDLYNRKGLYAEAEAALLEALRINPQNVSAMTRLADTYRLQRRSVEALDMLNNAIGLEPGNWRVYSSLAHFHYRRGEYREAAIQFEVVLSLDERNSRILNGLAASHMMSGNFEAAAPIYAQSIDVRPDPTTYGNLALMHYYLGSHDRAIASIEKGIEVAPNNRLLWANLGDILTNATQHDDARFAYRRARELVAIEIEVNPNDPALMMDAAWIEAMLGEEENAYARIARALEISPDDPYASYIEGLIFNRYDNTDAALESLELAVAKGYPTTILKAEPFLSGLRDHPRFDALVSED